MLPLTWRPTPSRSPAFHFHPELPPYPSRRSSGCSPPRCAAEGEEPQFEIDRDKAREALRKLDEQLQSLSRQEPLPRKRPPAPDPNVDRNLITGMSEETPEFSGSYLAYFTVALVILTIFNNIVFNMFIKPSVDGDDQAARLERVPLSEPAE